jgi:hypothetical protein
MSRLSLDFSELTRNSIYFTDDMFSCHYERISGGFDIGVWLE